MNDSTIVLVVVFLMAILGIVRIMNHAWSNRSEKVKKKFLIMHRRNVLNGAK